MVSHSFQRAPITAGSDPGAATRMKLIINMVMGTVVASLSEGMAMAEKVGLDLEDVAEVLSLGSLRCPTIVHKSQGNVWDCLSCTYNLY